MSSDWVTTNLFTYVHNNEQDIAQLYMQHHAMYNTKTTFQIQSSTFPAISAHQTYYSPHLTQTNRSESRILVT